MKKILAVLLAAAMILATLAGCTNTPAEPEKTENAGKQEDTTASEKADDTKGADTSAADTEGAESTENAESTEGTEGEEKWTGEVEPIVIVMLNGGQENKYLDQVAEELNPYLRDKIGVEVSFKQASVFDAASQYTMWIGGGETIDIMPVAFAPVSAFTNMNMMEPMDDLLQYAPHIEALAAEGKPVYCPSADGHIYGISTLTEQSTNGDGIWFWEDDLTEAGLDYEDNQLVTLDEVDQIVRKIHDLYPDSYVGVYGSAPRSAFTIEADPLGADLSSGVILGTDSTEVVDYFETDGYKAYLELLRGWYLDGIVKKDAATTDALEGGSMTSDPENCRMMWNSYDTGIIDSLEQTNGKKVTALRTIRRNQNAMSDTGIYNCIPVTSAHPEAAMRFMDLLYSDKYVENTMYYGVEGVNFNYTDETQTAYMPNADASYWGLIAANRTLEVAIGAYDADKKALYEKFAEEVASHPTKGYGFIYNTANMANQITAVDAVLQEYRAALETGSADLDTVYPEFINKLKANGIDDIIADKQAQFDAWLAEK